MQNPLTLGPSEELQGLTVQGVVVTYDGDVGGKTVEVGSVWYFPSTP